MIYNNTPRRMGNFLLHSSRAIRKRLRTFYEVYLYTIYISIRESWICEIGL